MHVKGLVDARCKDTALNLSPGAQVMKTAAFAELDKAQICVVNGTRCGL